MKTEDQLIVGVSYYVCVFLMYYSYHWCRIFFMISPVFVSHTFVLCKDYAEYEKKNRSSQCFFFHFQSLLADMYYYGKRGLQRDLNRAVKYYQMGADKGDPEGLYNLGISKLRVRKTAIE